MTALNITGGACCWQLATGVVDHLPEIAGLADRWGQSVFHCPYCHGYELDQGHIDVIATGPMSIHQAQFLPEWGPTTYLLNGAVELDAETTATLHARNVTIEHRPITRIDGTADVVLTDGSMHRFAGLFVAPRCSPNGMLAETLGCTLAETPMGTQIRTDEGKETTTPGVYVCAAMPRACRIRCRLPSRMEHGRA